MIVPFFSAWMLFPVILRCAQDLRGPTIRVPTSQILSAAKDDMMNIHAFFVRIHIISRLFDL